MFESFITAVEFLNSSQKYNSGHVEKIQKFMKEKSTGRRQLSELWECDENLPKGWKTRLINGWKNPRRIFLAPDGDQFASERIALQYMIKENYEPMKIKK